MMEKMNGSCGEGFWVKRYIGPSVSNVISLMAVGKRWDYEDEVRSTIDKVFLADNSNTQFNYYSAGSHFTFMMKFFLDLIPAFLIPDLKRMITYLPNLITKITREQKETVDQMSDRELSEPSHSFIDAYLKHLKVLETTTDEKQLEEKKYFAGKFPNFRNFRNFRMIVI